MATKIFGEYKIQINTFSKKHAENAKGFRNFINSLVEEEAKISMNKKISLKEEKKWLEENLKKIKNHKMVLLVAENKDGIVGTAQISSERMRLSHVGTLGITIKNSYRRIGLGTYLMSEIIKLAKQKLHPKVKVIRLSVYEGNLPALQLYEKMGFKKAGQIQKQIEYKGKYIDEIIMLKEV